GSGSWSFEATRSRPVADEVHDLRARWTAPRQRCGRVREDDLCGCGAHGDIPGGVGRGEVGAAAGTRRLLDEVVAARLKDPRQVRHRPARAGGRCVLDRPAGQVDLARAAIEDLDEVVPEGRAAVSAAAVDLTDYCIRDSAPQGRYG